MLRSYSTKVLILILTIALSISLCACAANNVQHENITNGLSNTIQIAGSTSVQPLSEELARRFMDENKNVRINIAGGGSGAGIKSAADGTADIGVSSRELKAEEKNIKEFVIAYDGIAIIVNKNNPVSDLKWEEIKKIFTGEITDWSEVGGVSEKIQVVTREEGSGTYEAFTKLVIGENSMVTNKAVVQNSSGAIRTAVASDKNAIGFISFGTLNDDIKAVKVDGVEPTEENVAANIYKIWRPFLYLTQKDPDGIVKSYIDWVLSEKGQEIVKSQGFIKVEK